MLSSGKVTRTMPTQVTDTLRYSVLGELKRKIMMAIEVTTSVVTTLDEVDGSEQKDDEQEKKGPGGVVDISRTNKSSTSMAVSKAIEGGAF